MARVVADFIARYSVKPNVAITRAILFTALVQLTVCIAIVLTGISPFPDRTGLTTGSAVTISAVSTNLVAHVTPKSRGTRNTSSIFIARSTLAIRVTR